MWWQACKIICVSLFSLCYLEGHWAKVLFVAEYQKLLEYFPSPTSIPLLPSDYSSVFFQGTLKAEEIAKFSVTFLQFNHFQQVDGTFCALYSASFKAKIRASARLSLVPRNSKDLYPDSINRPFSRVDYENYATIDPLILFDSDEFLFRLCITVSKFFHFNTCNNVELKQMLIEHLDDKEFEKEAKEIKSYIGKLIDHFATTRDQSQSIVHMKPLFKIIESRLSRT